MLAYVTTMTNAVETELTTGNLIRLAEREIGAIHVRGYYPPDIAESIADKAIHHDALGNYHKQHTSSVGRVHMPHIDTKFDPDLIAKYHDGALEATRNIREMFEPYLAPIDKVRLDLQELWPGGANILHLRGRSCFVGALRVFQPTTSQFWPHNDALEQETDAPEADGILNQLVANVYLRVPKDGGVLHLWLREPDDQEKQTILDVEGIDPAMIEAPVLQIHPDSGDLIIFSPRMLHAVTSGNASHRVGAATFIASKGRDVPLELWS
jgi:hypothetical protein